MEAISSILLTKRFGVMRCHYYESEINPLNSEAEATVEHTIYHSIRRQEKELLFVL